MNNIADNFSAIRAGMSAIAPAVDAANPDAELINLCAQYEAAEREVEDLYAPEDVAEDQASISLVAIFDRMQRPILDRMEAIYASTAAGIHARARAVAACNPNFDHSFEVEGTLPRRLLACLMRDAMALGEVEAPTVLKAEQASEDAKLTALYSTFKQNLDAFRRADSEAESDQFHETYWAAIDAMCNIPAASSVGLSAKAKVIQDYLPNSDDAMNPLIFSLAADCVRLGREVQ